MCTVTWLLREGGFDLFCNRDELRTRGAARPPELHRIEGVACLSPVDSDAGGTWIVVNEHGLALCILNDYRSPSPDPAVGFVSRGLLVRSLAALARRGRALERLSAIDLSSYRPFHLLVLAPDGPAAVFDWNGREGRLRPDEPDPPLSSSSFDPDGAEARRRALFDRVLAGGGSDPAAAHGAYHRSHRPERGPYSPCMHRQDAATVSFSRIRVEPERITFAYADGPPCRTPVSEPLILARRERDRPMTAPRASG